MKTIIKQNKIKNIAMAANSQNTKWDKKRIEDIIYNTLSQGKDNDIINNYFTSKDGTQYPLILSGLCKLPKLDYPNLCCSQRYGKEVSFAKMTSLEDISELDNYTLKFKSGAFQSCSSLTPDQLKYIHLKENSTSYSSFFEGCKSLTDIQEINSWKFYSFYFYRFLYGCEGLENVDLILNIEPTTSTFSKSFYNFIGYCRSSLKDFACHLNISNYTDESLTAVSFSSFAYYDYALKRFVFRSNIPIEVSTVIDMFGGCSSLEFIDIRDFICSKNCTTNSSTMQYVPKNVVIIVRDETEKDWWIEKFPDYKDCFYVPEESSSPVRLDYIESNGDTYIDTGFIPNQDTKVELIFMPLSEDDQYYFGSRTDVKQNAYTIYRNTNTLYHEYGNSSMSFPSASNLNVKHVITKTRSMREDLGGGGLTSGAIISTQTFTCPDSAYIFGCRNGGNNAKMRLYSCRIYDNDTLVRNYLPCLDRLGVPCLYDAVEGTYAYSAIEGKTFTPGEILYAPEGFNYVGGVTAYADESGAMGSMDEVAGSTTTISKLEVDEAFDNEDIVGYDIKIER